MCKNEIRRAAQFKFPLLDTVKSKPGQRNLQEMIGQFPKQGKDMKIFKKYWPDNSYYKIYHIQRNQADSDRYYGLKYWKGKLVSHKVEKIRGVKKRGLWRFEIDSAFELTEDDIEAYMANKA